MTARQRIALFIDAENVAPKYLPDYLVHCRGLGKPTIARCYGGAAGLKKWEKAIAEYHILPMLTPPSANKENASDFALTIDVVALLHRGLFDHAVIVSSDADFTQLAIHIREYGKGIDGIGEAKSPRIFRDAFDCFTEIPAPKDVHAKEAKSKPVTSATPEPPKPTPKFPTPPAIEKAWLLKLFKEVCKEAEFADMHDFARALIKAKPDYRKGYRTLDNYLRKSGLFEVRSKKVYHSPS